MMMKRHSLIMSIVLIEMILVIGIAGLSLKTTNQKNSLLVDQSAQTKVITNPSFFSNSNLLGADTQQWKLNNELSKYLDKVGYNGTISVYREKRLLFQRGYGQISKKNTLYYDYNTIFPIYSIQRELNKMLLLHLANQKGISILAHKNYIKYGQTKFSIADLITDNTKLTAKDVTLLNNQKNLKNVVKYTKKNTLFLHNEVAIVYLIQKLSGMNYEKYLEEYTEAYKDLDIRTTNDFNDLNEIKNHVNTVDMINNVLVDTQSFAVMQSLVQAAIQTEHLDADKVLKSSFNIEFGYHGYLLDKHNVINGYSSPSKKNEVAFVIQTKKEKSHTYYKRIMLKIYKLCEKYYD